MNLATALHLSKGQRKGLYLEICAETTFITSPRWGRRADTHRIGNAIVAIPHPYDILIAKLHRLESKDLTAFKLMVEKTAHPTEKEFLEELRAANRLFNRREYNPESHLPRQHHESKIRENTCRLWRELWGRQVNINREILEPVERELEEIIAIERPGIKESLVSGLPPKIDGQVLNKFRARSIGKHQP